MKKIAGIAFAFSFSIAALFACTPAKAEIRYSIGTGIGLMYTGFGASFAGQTASSFGYVSLGCLGWSSNGDSNCGFSAGYATSRFFSTPNVTLGVYANASNNVQDGIAKDSTNEHRFGVSLNYHFRGINNSGFITGITGYMLDYEQRTEPRLGLHLGYQW